MSLAAIRSALEGALNTITPAIATAWENMPYTPTTGVPFQQAFLLPAQPDNIEIGPGYVEQGILAVNLFYPKGVQGSSYLGAAPATARAALIRAKFPFGASFSSGGVTVNIIATPEIGPARPEDDRYMVPVRTRWRAHI